MLTPKTLAALPDPMIPLVSELEDSIIRDISRRITKANYLTPTAEWQLYKSSILRKSSDEVMKEIAKYTGRSQREIKKLMTDACRESLHTDAEIYRQMGKDAEAFFRSVAFSNILKAGIKNTGGVMKNFTRTTAVTARNTLSRYLDKAYLEVNSGAFSYQEAISKAVSSLGAEGLKVVKYASGRTDQMDVAVRRAVLTGVSQTAGKLQLQMAEDMDQDLVQVTKHLGARPSHAEWQGGIYSISGKSKKYRKLSEATGYGTGAGLKGWNCRHDFYPWFDGISLPEGSQIDPEENAREYEESQKQRAFERAIRKSKRRLTALDEAMKSTEDDQLKEQLQRKFDRGAAVLKKQEAKMNIWLKATGRNKDSSRLQSAGFNRSVSQKAVWGANKYRKSNSKLVEISQLKQYTDENGIFDLEEAKIDLLSKIDRLPKYKELFQNAFDEVYFYESDIPYVRYAYNSTLDAVYYNPNNPDFGQYDFSDSVLHELAHRIDHKVIHSYDNKAFSTAVSKNISKEAIEAYKGNLRENIYLSDIVGALSNNSVECLVASHPDEYWEKPHTKELEIFAEITMLEIGSEEACIGYINQYMPDIYRVYMEMMKGR